MGLDQQSEAARARAKAMGLPEVYNISPIEARNREAAEIRAWGSPVYMIQDLQHFNLINQQFKLFTL